MYLHISHHLLNANYILQKHHIDYENVHHLRTMLMYLFWVNYPSNLEHV